MNFDDVPTIRKTAIICDLDGTLALHNNRSVFEYDKCDTDSVNKVVQTILWTNNLHHHIIFLTGREESCREKTEHWLKHVAGMRYFDLHMRKIKDNRRDTIYKTEVYEQIIKPEYDIFFVMEDRTRVVKMWRDLGLTCLQVCEGDY